MSQGVFFIFFTFLAKIAGFIRDVILSYFYGASNIVDAYFVATTIPMVIFSFVGTGIQTSLIPMLSRVEKDNEDVKKFINNISNVFVSLCIVAIIIVMIFTEPVIRLFAAGFDKETMMLAVSFTRFSIIGIIFSTLTYIYTGYLQFKNRFIITALSIILMDLVVFLFVILSHMYGIILLPIGNVVALLSQSIFLKYFSKIKIIKVFDLQDPYLKVMALTIVPTIIGTSVNQINTLVSQSIGSLLGEGSISYLNYANKVLGVVQGVFIITVISYLFPRITKIILKRTQSLIEKSSVNWIILLQLFVIPCTVVFCFFSNEIINLLFVRGQFSKGDANITAEILFLFSLQLPFYAIRELISRIYFANGDTKLPMRNAILSLVVNAGSCLILSHFIGIGGIALANTIACFITAINILRHYVKDYNIKCSSFISKITGHSILFLTFIFISILLQSLITQFAPFEFVSSFIIELVIVGLLYCLFIGIYFLTSSNFRSMLFYKNNES